MISIKRTDSNDPNFIRLVISLDAYLAELDGKEHAFYSQFNKIQMLRHAVVAYNNEMPVGCGAIKEQAPGIMEVKRMYTLPSERRKGTASMILSELEKWTRELSYEKCVLETGKRQPEAIALYLKSGFVPTSNYGQYIGMENSVCFEKWLNQSDNARM